MNAFPNLFSSLNVGGLTLKNRVVFGPHGTTLGHDGKVTDALIAYHEARAKGGAGLIILESATVHKTYAYPEQFIYLGTDDCIPGLRKLARTCHQHDCKVFGQLFHAGRAVRISVDGSQSVAYAPSEIPDERYRIVPRPMETALVYDIIESYADAALRLKRAGCDGVEVLASMGYLVAQFLNPNTNQRNDEFGGSLENRTRFLRTILVRTREKVGDDFVIGIRVSGDELDGFGLDAKDMLAVCEMIDQENLVDYYNVIAGSSASPYGWIRVFPPMAIDQGYAANYAAKIRQRVNKPVIVGGRVNQPHMAEQLITDGSADLCAMVRPMIADPEFTVKAMSDRTNDIRACVACNQACVGHRLAHHSVSCIQYPESGRELSYANIPVATTKKKVMVIGAGPAGMKAAVVAAGRGHVVELFEQNSQLGGQVLLAQQLPGRAEFGGVITNLARELELSGVDVRCGITVTHDLIREIASDVIIMATGALPRMADIELDDDLQVVYAHEILKSNTKVGQSVVVADWRCDWIGLGVAEKLVRDGCHVRLAVNGIVAGENIQSIVRDAWIGELHKLGVEIIPYARVFGTDESLVYFQHITSHEPIVLDNVDTLVVAHGYQGNTALADSLHDFTGRIEHIGDCVQPRSVEEAVLDGLKVATRI